MVSSSSAVLLVDGRDLVVLVEVLAAVVDQDVRRALREDVEFRAFPQLAHRRHALPLGTEGDGVDDLLRLAQLPEVRAQRVHQLQEGALGLIADLSELGPLDSGVGVGVEGDGVGEQVLKVVAEALVLGLELGELDALGPQAGDEHGVLGERAGLVAADVVGAAHRLAGRQVAHEVLLVLHLAHAVRQRNSHCERQSLRHRHHHDAHRDDEVLDQVVEELHREESVLALVGVPQQVQEQGDEGQQG